MVRLIAHGCLILVLFQVAAARQQLNLSSFYDSLSHPRLDDRAAATVEILTVARGGQKISFTRGTLRLALPVGGRVCAAVFTGQGTFTLSPPTPAERSEFERVTVFKLDDGKHVFSFDRAVLWFNDTLLQELGKGVHFGQKDIVRIEEETLDKGLKYATDKANDNILHRLMTESLERDRKPYLFAEFSIPDKREIFFSYDLRRFEEISIYEPPYEAIAGAVFWLQLVNSFHLPEEYARATEYGLSGEDKKRFDVLSDSLDISVRKGGSTTGRAGLHIRSRSQASSTFRFILDPTLVVDSILTDRNERVSFHRSKEAWEGIVLLPRQDSSDVHLSFFYTGDFLKPYATQWLRIGTALYDTRKVAGSFYELSSSTGWYPQQAELERVTFDATYHVPDELEFVAAGRKLSEEKQPGVKLIRYASLGPAIINTFNLGYYKPETFQLSDSEPPVKIYDVGGGKPEEVGKDIANAMRLYTYLFGGTPYSEIRATGGPQKHGQAFQEFLNLPWFEEMVGEQGAMVALGRAHEVAHAWWGHGVGWKSYHDLWISEAFAEYSALLYAQFVLKKDKPLFDKLREWRDQIAGTRKFSLGSGPGLGSIWLGYRVSSAQTPGDYATSTYTKGAWVLHMLRMMLVDLKTFQEDTFKKMMAEFYLDFRGKDAGTEDFRAIVEKYFHTDMRWFFDEWVYGTEIPVLKCTHTLTKTPAGKYSLSIVVEQREVTKPFTLYLPFELIYGDRTTARARLLVDQLHKEFTYELDQEPEKVSFNIMESLLCPIEE